MQRMLATEAYGRLALARREARPRAPFSNETLNILL